MLDYQNERQSNLNYHIKQENKDKSQINQSWNTQNYIKQSQSSGQLLKRNNDQIKIMPNNKFYILQKYNSNSQKQLLPQKIQKNVNYSKENDIFAQISNQIKNDIDLENFYQNAQINQINLHPNQEKLNLLIKKPKQYCKKAQKVFKVKANKTYQNNKTTQIENNTKLKIQQNINNVNIINEKKQKSISFKNLNQVEDKNKMINLIKINKNFVSNQFLNYRNYIIENLKLNPQQKETLKLTGTNSWEKKGFLSDKLRKVINDQKSQVFQRPSFLQNI